MRTLSASQLAQLDTPCLVVDLAQVKENIEAMQREADKLHCRVRPHIKTHKMPLIAKMQVAAGADGITCAKVSEAEVMADGGLDDIFIAYPQIGAVKTRRVLALARRVKRLIVAVDSLEGARDLSQAAQEAGQQIEVRMEVDLGAGRTGVPMAGALALAQAIVALPMLQLEGIFGYKSLVYQGKPTADKELAAREEGELLAQAAAMLREAGIPIQSISGGSSPTGLALAATGQVKEIRPGTYVYKDMMLQRAGVAEAHQLALCYVATVVSCHHDDYAVIDGGSKTFATDIALNTAPANWDSYARVQDHPHLRLSRMSEEHGILRAVEGSTGLQVGQRLQLFPLHVCTAVNMHNSLYLLTEDGQLRRETIPARGMLT